MYKSDYSLPQLEKHVYDSTDAGIANIEYNSNGDDDRFFLGPLLVSGLAGGAIGYGLGASRPMPMPIPMPMPQTTVIMPQMQYDHCHNPCGNSFMM